MGTFRFKSDLRNHQAIVQPRLYDSLMVTQITLVPPSHCIWLQRSRCQWLRRFFASWLAAFLRVFPLTGGLVHFVAAVPTEAPALGVSHPGAQEHAATVAQKTVLKHQTQSEGGDGGGEGRPGEGPGCVGARSHMDVDVAERHTSGLSAVPSPAQPCGSKRDGPPAVRASEPRRIQTRAEHALDAHGSCKQAGPVGWGELVTCDEL